MTHLLLPRLQKRGARVINVSAVAHYAADLCLSNLNLQGCYSAREAFMQSKLALVMMTLTMAEKLKGNFLKLTLYKIIEKKKKISNKLLDCMFWPLC